MQCKMFVAVIVADGRGGRRDPDHFRCGNFRPRLRKDVVEESFKELGRRIERGAYYEKGRKEGIKEGIKEGKIEDKIEVIEMFIKIRFEERGLQRMRQIRLIQDLDKLNAILLLAMNAQNIEAFEQNLDSCL